MENSSTQLLARLASDINLHIVPFVESYRESNDKLNTILNKGIELTEDLKDIDPDVLYKVVAYVTNLVKFGISNQVNYKLLAEHCLFLKETIDSYLKQWQQQNEELANSNAELLVQLELLKNNSTLNS